MISCWIFGSSAPGHAVAGGAGEARRCRSRASRAPAAASLLRGTAARPSEPGASDDFTHGLRVRPTRVGVAREQARRDHVARIAGVGAAGDRRDDDRAVRHLARLSVPPGRRCRARPGPRRRQALVRVRRAGHVAHHGRQVEVQHALVLGGLEAVGPQAGLLRVGLDQLHLLVLAAGQLAGSRWSAGRCRTSPPSRRIPAPCWRWSRGRRA